MSRPTSSSPPTTILIPCSLYSVADPQTDRPYADWYVIFATNEMAIAHTATGAFVNELSADNWPEIINRDGVRLGIADPRLDADGYRALMTIDLAESALGRPRLFQDTFGDQFRVPLSVSHAGGVDLIRCPRFSKPRRMPTLWFAPTVCNCCPLLQSGEIDYAFEYVSVIKQHRLQYVALASEINLSEPSLADAYGRVEVPRFPAVCQRQASLPRRAHSLCGHHPQQRPPPRRCGHTPWPIYWVPKDSASWRRTTNP